MTKKDMKIVEKIVKNVLDDMIDDPEGLTLQGSGETMFSLKLLEEMEDYLGHSIEFMGIS
jgi:hypothetical protein|tara:strand:- start:59 stop:238 length:180 start_codon:yes stop_codon:yes gene_type:complete